MLKQQTYTLPHDRDNQVSSVGCLVLLFSKLSARIVILMKKGRARHPPENLQQWEVAKATTKTVECLGIFIFFQVSREYMDKDIESVPGADLSSPIQFIQC